MTRFEERPGRTDCVERFVVGLLGPVEDGLVRNEADLKEQFDAIWFSYVLVHIPFRLVPDALAALESMMHPEGSMMMIVSVVEEPQEKLHDSCVMFDEHGAARKVPVAHWAPDPLIALFRTRFEISWVSLKPFVDGYAQLSLLVRSRRSPADNQEH